MKPLLISLLLLIGQPALAQYSDGLKPGLYRVFPVDMTVDPTRGGYQPALWMVVQPGLETETRVFTYPANDVAKVDMLRRGINLPDIQVMPTIYPQTAQSQPSIRQKIGRGIFNFGSILAQPGPPLVTPAMQQPTRSWMLNPNPSHMYLMPDGSIYNTFSTPSTTIIRGF